MGKKDSFQNCLDFRVPTNGLEHVRQGFQEAVMQECMHPDARYHQNFERPSAPAPKNGQ